MCVPSLARPYLIRSLAEALAYRDIFSIKKILRAINSWCRASISIVIVVI